MPELNEFLTNEKFYGRVGLQQRVLPAYRVPFFEALAMVCEDGLEVLVGDPLDDEGIKPVKQLHGAYLRSSVNHHLFNPSSPLYLCWQEGVLSWLKDWQPDVLILEANPRYLSSYRAIRYMHQRNKPVIGWGLGAPRSAGSASRLLGWQRKYFINLFDAIISYSHNGAQEYKLLGFPPESIYVAPNAVAPRPKGPLQTKVERNREGLIVLFVGRLQTRKRVDLLIKACSNLPEKLQPWLVIVGDGPARFELETLAGEIYPRTEFLGSIHGSDLKPIFRDADLFVLPGTGGLAVQEAMANGLPVIVALGDGTQEDLVRPENGWLIPADNLGALQKTLEEALSDRNALIHKGIKSFHIVQREINLEVMVAVFLKALICVSNL
jgi:glycosyltransferase involved in cell wall biosynthesis